jgi:hypothetical protein
MYAAPGHPLSSMRVVPSRKVILTFAKSLAT